MTQQIDSSMELRRQDILASISKVRIPNEILRALARSHYNERDYSLAIGVLKIELYARPFFLRLIEYSVGFAMAVRSLILGRANSDITVGCFQIGVITSLRWTASPITPTNFLLRLFLLATATGSARIFRIGVRRFEQIEGTTSYIEEFADFYNGKGRLTGMRLPYREVLAAMLRNDQPKSASLKIRDDAGRQDYSKILERADERIMARLDRIKKIIEPSDKLRAVLVLCSVSQQRVIYTKTYGGDGRDYPVLIRPRSVGSTLKIALYSAFLEKYRLLLTEEMNDGPVQIAWRGDVLRPRNADNIFRGRVTLQYAFANSINIPALEIIQKLGVEEFVLYLRKCGIHQPLPKTPLLALGPIKLTAFELLATLSPVMTQGYLQWARSGREEIPIPANNGERLLSVDTACQVKMLLKATALEGTAKFLNRAGRETLGGKTGTSEGNRDFWFVGLVDEDLYGLIWLGDAAERSMLAIDGQDASASRFAVPFWSDVLAAFEH